MSLKLRLTLLYMAIFGGILLLFSMAIYSLISVTLIEQIDDVLEHTMNEVLKVTSVTQAGDLEISTALTLDSNMFVQAWGRDGAQKAASYNIGYLRRPMDALGLQTDSPVFRDVQVGEVHLRVLSVPLKVGPRTFGTLQVGTSMAVVDGTLADLFRSLTAACIIAMIIAGVIGFIITQSALAPLGKVTQAALQITETKDLSRRIPAQGSSNDEVGQLVQAFNLNLSRLERMIETQRRFVADVGHELRTPLTVIKGNVNLMQRFGEMDDESLTSIVDEVDRLTRLVGDLLLLAQAEAGKLPLDRKPVELDAVLFEVLRTAKVLAKDQVTLRLGSIDQVLVCGDQDRLKQVILNLIGNGIKYTPPGGDVVVALGKEGDEARLEINDTGPGIPPEDLPHIFERFYRGEKSRMRSADGKGFGLGLSIAYWIIHNHGGRIEVESEIGKGTVFCICLPLAEGDCSGYLEE